MHEYSSNQAWFEHSKLFKVNLSVLTDNRRRSPVKFWQNTRVKKSVLKQFKPTNPRRNPTTSFLTTTTLIYAIGAGTPAAAEAPDLPSNRSSGTVLKCTHSNYKASEESCIVIFRHYLGLRPLGNLRACCLPWMW